MSFDDLSFSVKMYFDVNSRKMRIGTDGLNSFAAMKYTKQVTNELLVTRIKIDLKR